MRLRAAVAPAYLCVVSGNARIMQPGPEAAPGDATTLDAVEQPELIVERPAPGLARGHFAWPAWAIGALGGLALALAVAYFLWRWRKRRR